VIVKDNIFDVCSQTMCSSDGGNDPPECPPLLPQARISSFVVINNSGNVPYPRRLRSVLPITQIAVMGFPWVSANLSINQVCCGMCISSSM
jgi:hypothetical protein